MENIKVNQPSPEIPQNPIVPQPSPKIIGEGAYGCAFRPGINCKGKAESDLRYISKLQSSKLTTINEIEISQKIQKIPNYEENFAPIIENCSIKIGEIETKEIDNCKTIEDTNLDINKIKYVGEDSLSKYLLKMLKTYPKKFLEIFLETHRILLESLRKLNIAGIIHNDVKENNIMCRELDGRPILIDFGLSMDNEFMKLPSTTANVLPLTMLQSATTTTTTVTPSIAVQSKISTYFFKYDTSYEVWSIEIHILNYMLDILNVDWKNTIATETQINKITSVLNQNNEMEKIAGSQLQSLTNKNWSSVIYKLEDVNNPLLGKIYELYGYNWRTQIVKREEINKIVNEYIYNLSKKSFLKSQDELTNYKSKLLNYLLGFENKTWENLFNELIKYRETWDNYSLCIVYLKLLNNLNLNQQQEGSDIGMFKKYENLLLKNLFSLPNERKKPEEIAEELKQVLQTTSQFQFKNIFDIILGNIKQQRDIVLKIARDQKDTNRQERVIYSAKR